MNCRQGQTTAHAHLNGDGEGHHHQDHERPRPASRSQTRSGPRPPKSPSPRPPLSSRSPSPRPGPRPGSREDRHNESGLETSDIDSSWDSRHDRAPPNHRTSPILANHSNKVVTAHSSGSAQPADSSWRAAASSSYNNSEKPSLQQRKGQPERVLQDSATITHEALHSVPSRETGAIPKQKKRREPANYRNRNVHF